MQFISAMLVCFALFVGASARVGAQDAPKPADRPADKPAEPPAPAASEWVEVDSQAPLARDPESFEVWNAPHAKGEHFAIDTSGFGKPALLAVLDQNQNFDPLWNIRRTKDGARDTAAWGARELYAARPGTGPRYGPYTPVQWAKLTHERAPSTHADPNGEWDVPHSPFMAAERSKVFHSVRLWLRFRRTADGKFFTSVCSPFTGVEYLKVDGLADAPRWNDANDTLLLRKFTGAGAESKLVLFRAVAKPPEPSKPWRRQLDKFEQVAEIAPEGCAIVSMPVWTGDTHFACVASHELTPDTSAYRGEVRVFKVVTEAAKDAPAAAPPGPADPPVPPPAPAKTTIVQMVSLDLGDYPVESATTPLACSRAAPAQRGADAVGVATPAAMLALIRIVGSERRVVLVKCDQEGAPVREADGEKQKLWLRNGPLLKGLQGIWTVDEAKILPPSEATAVAFGVSIGSRAYRLGADGRAYQLGGWLDIPVSRQAVETEGKLPPSARIRGVISVTGRMRVVVTTAVAIPMPPVSAIRYEARWDDPAELMMDFSGYDSAFDGAIREAAQAAFVPHTWVAENCLAATRIAAATAVTETAADGTRRTKPAALSNTTLIYSFDLKIDSKQFKKKQGDVVEFFSSGIKPPAAPDAEPPAPTPMIRVENDFDGPWDVQALNPRGTAKKTPQAYGTDDKTAEFRELPAGSSADQLEAMLNARRLLMLTDAATDGPEFFSCVGKAAIRDPDTGKTINTWQFFRKLSDGSAATYWFDRDGETHDLVKASLSFPIGRKDNTDAKQNQIDLWFSNFGDLKHLRTVGTKCEPLRIPYTVRGYTPGANDLRFTATFKPSIKRASYTGGTEEILSGFGWSQLNDKHFGKTYRLDE
jgi:hypothetical protein